MLVRVILGKMKKLFYILLFFLLGCSPKIAEPIYKEGILISTEKIQLSNKYITVHWRILTEKGDTIDRYLIRVDPNTMEGSVVPYFNYNSH